MSQADGTAVVDTKDGSKDGASAGSGGGTPKGAVGGSGKSGGAAGGLFRQYKPEQGKWTRLGTFSGLLTLAAWGAKFLYDQLQVYEGDKAWNLMVTTVVPIAFVVVVGTIAWWVTYANRKSGDFMIGTEGEMKKVSWSSKGEVIGSTKVVILFTVLLAAVLFGVDLLFQAVFTLLGVLKVGGG